MSFAQLLASAAAHDLNDFVLTITMVEGTPVFQLRAQGDMTTAPTYWSVEINTLTPTTDPNA